MGGALARGLAHGSIVKTSDIYVSNPSTAKLEALRREFSEINTTTNNCEAATAADIIVLAVKPWKVVEVLEEIARRDDTQYSYRNALVAEVDGRSVGAIIAYDGALLYPLRRDIYTHRLA